MTLYRTKRTKLWYNYPLLSCSIVRSTKDCIQVQVPTALKNKTSESVVLTMKWECVSKKFDQCIQAQSIQPLDGSKKVVLKVCHIIRHRIYVAGRIKMGRFKTEQV